MIVKLKTVALKKYLARRNMSQNCFAQKIKVSSGYMSQILCGERNPSPSVRERILDALNSSQKFRGQPEYRFDDFFLILCG